MSNTNYPWALNALKLQRAISLSKDGNAADVLAKYEEIGGLVDYSIASEEFGVPAQENVPVQESVSAVIEESKDAEAPVDENVPPAESPAEEEAHAVGESDRRIDIEIPQDEPKKASAKKTSKRK